MCIRLTTLMTHLILNSHNLKWGVIMIIPASPYSSRREKLLSYGNLSTFPPNSFVYAIRSLDA